MKAQSSLHLSVLFLTGMRSQGRDQQQNLDQRGSATLLIFAIEPLGNGETPSTLSPPLLKEEPPQCPRRGAIYIDIASEVGGGSTPGESAHV